MSAVCKSILGQNVSTIHQLESQGRKKKKACLFEPVQVVCLESGEAHVVAAGATVAGRAGRAGNAYFVGGLSNPVPPAGERSHPAPLQSCYRKFPEQLTELARHYVSNPVALVPVLPFTCFCVSCALTTPFFSQLVKVFKSSAPVSLCHVVPEIYLCLLGACTFFYLHFASGFCFPTNICSNSFVSLDFFFFFLDAGYSACLRLQVWGLSYAEGLLKSLWPSSCVVWSSVLLTDTLTV